MITCYFGIPGVGKDTMLTKFARREYRLQKLSKIFPFVPHYDHIYTDFYVEGAEKFSYDYFRKYKFYNSLVLLNEMSLYADNRKFKSFTDEERDFFTLHRHLGCDIIYATQDYSKVDAKVRALTQELWYLSKTVVPVLKNFTFAKRIYRHVTINEHQGDLIFGYRFCNFLESLFVSNCILCFRPFHYKYFNSFEEGNLETRPVLISEPWASSVSDQKETSPTSRNRKGMEKLLCKTKNKAKQTLQLLGLRGTNSKQNVKIIEVLNDSEVKVNEDINIWINK